MYGWWGPSTDESRIGHIQGDLCAALAADYGGDRARQSWARAVWHDYLPVYILLFIFILVRELEKPSAEAEESWRGQQEGWPEAYTQEGCGEIYAREPVEMNDRVTEQHEKPCG